MIARTDLSKPIYDQLKEMIRNGTLRPGEKIVQEKIAEALGVSRTPLMKALLTLENEYLVESIPRRGMFVRMQDPQELIHVYICREAIEGMAARLLADGHHQKHSAQLKACFSPFIGVDQIDAADYTKADELFHKLLIQLTGNGPLDKIYFFGNIHDKVIGHGLVRSPEETLEEHFNIINAIEAGKPDEAEQAARNHILRSRAMLEAQLRASGTE